MVNIQLFFRLIFKWHTMLILISFFKNPEILCTSEKIETQNLGTYLREVIWKYFKTKLSLFYLRITHWCIQRKNLKLQCTTVKIGMPLVTVYTALHGQSVSLQRYRQSKTRKFISKLIVVKIVMKNSFPTLFFFLLH